GVAAVNGPDSVVISGDRDTALDFMRTLRAQGFKTRRLKVSHAFHSLHMDGAMQQLADVAATLTFESPQIPRASNVTGTAATAQQLASPEYWARQMRGAVRFADGIDYLEKQGVTAFVELGPAPVLAPMARECLAGMGELDRPAFTVPALRTDRTERQ